MRRSAAFALHLHRFSNFVPILFVSILFANASPAAAVCPEQPPLQNYTAGGQAVCPCFIAGEQAGSVFTAPVADYPIEILRVGIGWGSYFGGSPQQQEQAVNVFAGGLPNPGSPIFTLPGPVLTDGYINQFDLEPLPGEVVVNSGPFTVTLQFMNDNANNYYAPSVIDDANGCQSGKNVIYAIPGGWMNACAAGVTGDWIFFAVYRQANCTTSAEEHFVASRFLLPPQPNPFRGSTRISYVVSAEAPITLSVFDVAGRLVRDIVRETMGSGWHTATWDGTDSSGRPAAAGTYFIRFASGGESDTRPVLLVR